MEIIDYSGLKAILDNYEVRIKNLENPSIPIPKRLYRDDCIWNKKLTTESLNINSVNMVSTLMANLRDSNAWLNSAPLSVPLYFVTYKDPFVEITKTAEPASPVTAELAKGINIPKNFQADGGGDGHAYIINLSSGKRYGFWKLKLNVTNNHWECTSASIGDNAQGSDGTTDKIGGWWNSATASHIDLGAGLIRKIDVEAGVIPHAISFSASQKTTSRWDRFVYPARSSDGASTEANSVPMGTRFRFPSGVVIKSTWTPMTKMLVTAVRDYGMILRDTTGLNGVVIYAENCTQYGMTTNDSFFDPYLNGKKIWDVVGTKAVDGEFPWSQLQALA